MHEITRKQGEDAFIVPPRDSVSSSGTSQGSRSPLSGAAQLSLKYPTTIYEVLAYMKGAFDDETALDRLPLEAAGNSGAWKAWRAYRKSEGVETQDASTPEHGAKCQDEWSWDGVWEERVRKGIDNSIADATLYGGAGGGGDVVSSMT